MATAKKTAARKTAKAADTVAEDAFSTAENMSNAARDQFETIIAKFTENAETFRAQSEEMMESVRGNFETAQTRFQTVNADLAAAARDEAAEAVEFVNSLSRATTLADAFEIQRDYWTNLFETRVERTRDLAKVSMDAARDSFEPFAKSMNAYSPTASFEKFFPFAAK